MNEGCSHFYRWQITHKFEHKFLGVWLKYPWICWDDPWILVQILLVDPWIDPWIISDQTDGPRCRTSNGFKMYLSLHQITRFDYHVEPKWISTELVKCLSPMEIGNLRHSRNFPNSVHIFVKLQVRKHYLSALLGPALNKKFRGGPPGHITWLAP